jgi:Transcriptional regulators containing a DNA-binding HTH domain and an aminotransferase domain (MocR family) and their eukaryotic orthologs
VSVTPTFFEDDHNSEFRFTGPPLPCLQGLDNSGRVIYAGTMSKILYPSLRLGYILAPEQLVEPMIKIRAVTGPAFARDRSSDARAIPDRGIFPEPHQANAETLFRSKRLLHRTIQ